MLNMIAKASFGQNIAIVCFTIVISACAPNNLSIRLAYSRLDNSIHKSFNEYATFDDEQRAWIRSAASEYQKWHRKSELPQYAILFNETASMLETTQPASNNDVARIFHSLESFSRRSFVRSPFSHSVPFLGKLTDEQVHQIDSSFAKQNERQLDHIRKHSVLSDNSERIDNMVRTLSRIGLKLNSDQRSISDRGLKQYVGNREDRVFAWQIWQDEFIRLLGIRNQPGVEALMQKHINQYQLQMELRYPERSTKNREIAIATIAQLLNSLTGIQREKLVSTLRDSSTVLVAMAASKQTELL